VCVCVCVCGCIITYIRPDWKWSRRRPWTKQDFILSSEPFVHSNWCWTVWCHISAMATYTICIMPLFRHTAETSGWCHAHFTSDSAKISTKIPSQSPLILLYRHQSVFQDLVVFSLMILLSLIQSELFSSCNVPFGLNWYGCMSFMVFWWNCLYQMISAFRRFARHTRS